jgi:hypothetical protein
MNRESQSTAVPMGLERYSQFLLGLAAGLIAYVL